MASALQHGGGSPTAGDAGNRSWGNAAAVPIPAKNTTSEAIARRCQADIANIRAHRPRTLISWALAHSVEITDVT